MKIELMYNKSETNVIGKSYDTVATYTGELRESSPVIDPVILVQVNQDRQNITQCNYCYIPEFKRYYFINEMIAVRNNLWELHMHCDVLETYKGYIRAQNALVSRAPSPSAYVPDSEVTTYNNPIIQTLQFPTGFTAHEYLLTVVGSLGNTN